MVMRFSNIHLRKKALARSINAGSSGLSADSGVGLDDRRRYPSTQFEKLQRVDNINARQYPTSNNSLM